MPTLLLPGGVRCSVSAGARLSFPPRADDDQDAYLSFEVEGVVFELRRSILDGTPEFADSFFGRAAAFTGAPLRLQSHSAELFPLVLDYMVRRAADPKACLRMAPLTLAETHALDELEEYLFPGMAPDRVFADPERTRVLVALLPWCVGPEFMEFALCEWGTQEAHSDAFWYSKGLEALSLDARFVRLVQAKRVAGSEATALQLEKDYALRAPFTDALLEECELVVVDRGVPFRIESHMSDGDHYQSVVNVNRPHHVY